MKDKLKSLGIIIIVIYFFISSFIMVPLYTYKDIKENDSFFRYFVVSPIIGVLKGYTWPYHIYYNSTLSKENELGKREVKNFFKAYDKYIKATDNLREWTYSDKNKDAESFKAFFNESIDTYIEINEILIVTDNNILNQVYEGLGSTKVNFQEAIEEYIIIINKLVNNELQNKNERDLLIYKADSKLYEVQKWFKDNQKELQKALNKVLK